MVDRRRYEAPCGYRRALVDRFLNLVDGEVEQALAKGGRTSRLTRARVSARAACSATAQSRGLRKVVA